MSQPLMTTPGRQYLTSVLLVIGAGLLALSLRLPYWHLRVVAPQYPSGLTLTIYPNRLTGDVQEIDTLNHYIGMRPLAHGALLERRLAVPALLAVTLGLLAAAILPWRWAWLLALPAVLVPGLFLGDLYWWLRDYGLHLNPKAPLNHAIKPFIPTILGPGKIAQFTSLAWLGAGFWLSAGTVGLTVTALVLRWVKPARAAGRALLAAGVLLIGAPGSSEAATWVVGAEEACPTIQAAIRSAEAGDTIEVRAGVYRGPLVVDKPVQLIGDGHAVIDGGGEGSVVRITAPEVTMRGFIVRHSGTTLAAEDCGVVVSAPDVRLEANQLEDVLFGIHLRHAPRSVLSRNRLRSKAVPVPRRGDLIRVWYSNDVVLERNVIHGGRDAVLWFSKALRIHDNEFVGGRYGLHFMYCEDALVTHNRLTENSVGIYLMYSRGLRLEHNWIVNNRGPSGYGVGLKDMEDTYLAENVIADNRAGMFLDNAAGRFERNLFAYNDTGILTLPSASRNIFSSNNFIENGEQVRVEGQGGVLANQWRGNFWSDYRGYDAARDGIGDLPYRSMRLFEQLTGRYPALKLFLSSPAAQAVDFASSRFPIFAPHPTLEDPTPRMAPVEIPVDRPPTRGAWPWVFVSGALMVSPFGLLTRRQPALPAPSRVPPEPPSASATTAVVVRHLTKRFGPVIAAHDVTFEVPVGAAIALWGPNGAGKTTILRCLLGLIPFEGTAQVWGMDVVRDGKAARRFVGYVPQEIRLHADQTVQEALEFYAQLRKVPLARSHQLLREWQLEAVAGQSVSHLSGGMKQKLALSIGLLSDPPILLLDEPTSNLDRATRREFAATLDILKRAGKTLIFCSHRTDEVWRLADRVVVLEGGRTIAEGPPAALRDHLRERTALWITVAPSRLPEAVALLEQRGYVVQQHGTQLWIPLTSGEKMDLLRILLQAEIPVLDFELDQETS